jgi:hypothetical protein
MRRYPVRFSESEASNHTPSLADFTTTTPELKFSVHTAQLRLKNALDKLPKPTKAKRLPMPLTRDKMVDHDAERMAN